MPELYYGNRSPGDLRGCKYIFREEGHNYKGHPRLEERAGRLIGYHKERGKTWGAYEVDIILPAGRRGVIESWPEWDKRQHGCAAYDLMWEWKNPRCVACGEWYLPLAEDYVIGQMICEVFREHAICTDGLGRLCPTCLRASHDDVIVDELNCIVKRITERAFQLQLEKHNGEGI